MSCVVGSGNNYGTTTTKAPRLFGKGAQLLYTNLAFATMVARLQQIRKNVYAINVAKSGHIGKASRCLMVPFHEPKKCNKECTENSPRNSFR